MKAESVAFWHLKVNLSIKDMKTNIKKIASITAGFALVASMLLANSVNAAENPQGQGKGDSENNIARMGRPAMMKPTINGTVTSISGNSITVAVKGHKGKPGATSTPSSNPVIYTVNATNAVVMSDKATSTIASIVVGDKIMVQGTVTGTNVVATTIRDNKIGKPDDVDKKKSTSTPPAFVGNGQPIVAGKIVTVSGNSLTVTTASNLTYTVDATNAKILKGPTTIAVGGLVVGDTVVIQGTINGSSVTASTIMDRSVVNPVNPPANPGGKGKGGGFFGGIGKFFMSMFGF